MAAPSDISPTHPLIPAQAGIQDHFSLGPRLRGDERQAAASADPVPALDPEALQALADAGYMPLADYVDVRAAFAQAERRS